MAGDALTIGELAKRGNVSTSLLRYYEKEQLLKPTGRSAAGYRLYAPDAERTLRFIRSAQRYGFSLNDIKLILGTDGKPAGDDAGIVDIARQRFLEIERRVTEMLVLRHELELFLDDVASLIDPAVDDLAGEHCRELLEQVCGHEHPRQRRSSLQKLTGRLGCNLASAEWKTLFKDLRGQHMHIWRDEDGYAVQFSDPAPGVRPALERLAASESACDVHSAPEVTDTEGGCLFRARGPNAFLFAQLFLALESAEA